jgi:hypothetical protein
VALGDLVERRLGPRRPELEQAALARLHAIADPASTPDASYRGGLRVALSVAFDYAFAALDDPEGPPQPVPVELLSQARLAARNGVSLDAVLRRYAAGQGLIVDALLEEAAQAGISATELKLSLRALSSRFDDVVCAVGEEYAREEEARRFGPEQRRIALVRRLLAGEPTDASPLRYELTACHLGIAASGPGVGPALRSLAESLDRGLLLIQPDDHTCWAWLGGRRPLTSAEAGLLAAARWPAGVAVGCGVAAEGIAGWRLTHRQAAAALTVAQRLEGGFVAYPDAALLAAVLQDDLLAASLRQLFLDPLDEGRDRGQRAKRTLRAYLDAAGNASSAAAALGVSRRTVATRLAAIEELLGAPLEARAAEIEIALRLDEIDAG